MFLNITMFAFCLQNEFLELELLCCQNQPFFYLVNLQCLSSGLVTENLILVEEFLFPLCWLRHLMCVKGKLRPLIRTFRTANVFLTFSDTGAFECFISITFLRRLVGFVISFPPPVF